LGFEVEHNVCLSALPAPRRVFTKKNLEVNGTQTAQFENPYESTESGEEAFS
jgi:hypothetical protein